jgi:hypothetical protein
MTRLPSSEAEGGWRSVLACCVGLLTGPSLLSVVPGVIRIMISTTLRSRPGSHFDSATRLGFLVMDYELGHVYSSSHTLKPNNLLSMESAKQSPYCHCVSNRDQGFAFTPLTSNSLNQVGHEFLCFLWGVIGD